jgi:hypothetical protein
MRAGSGAALSHIKSHSDWRGQSSLPFNYWMSVWTEAELAFRSPSARSQIAAVNCSVATRIASCAARKEPLLCAPIPHGRILGETWRKQDFSGENLDWQYSHGIAN